MKAEACHECGETEADLVEESEDPTTGAWSGLYLCAACEARRDGRPVAECDNCRRMVPETDLTPFETCRQTHDSPADGEWRCNRCLPDEPEDEDYEPADDWDGDAA